MFNSWNIKQKPFVTESLSLYLIHFGHLGKISKSNGKYAEILSPFDGNYGWNRGSFSRMESDVLKANVYIPIEFGNDKCTVRDKVNAICFLCQITCLLIPTLQLIGWLTSSKGYVRAVRWSVPARYIRVYWCNINLLQLHLIGKVHSLSTLQSYANNNLRKYRWV